MLSESEGLKAAREVAEKIDKVVNLHDLRYYVIVRVDDGKFNFYPDALVVTWMDFFFIYQEHQQVEIHHKEDAQVLQLTEVPQEPLEGWLREKSCLYAKIGMNHPETSSLVKEYAPDMCLSIGEDDTPS